MKWMRRVDHLSACNKLNGERIYTRPSSLQQSVCSGPPSDRVRCPRHLDTHAPSPPDHYPSYACWQGQQAAARLLSIALVQLPKGPSNINLKEFIEVKRSWNLFDYSRCWLTGLPCSLIQNKYLTSVHDFDFEREINSQVCKRNKCKNQTGTIWDHLGSVTALVLGWIWATWGPQWWEKWAQSRCRESWL